MGSESDKYYPCIEMGLSKKFFNNNELIITPKINNFSFSLAPILLFIKTVFLILFLTNSSKKEVIP